jgi:hypothetical protein
VYVEAERFDNDTFQRLTGEAQGSLDNLDPASLAEAQARVGQLASLGLGFVYGGCFTAGGITLPGGRSCMTAWTSFAIAVERRRWTA